MIKAKTKVLVLAALAASAFLIPFFRMTACEKKYQGYYDRLEYAQYIPNPKQALATLNSITVPNDCLCNQEARKVEYQIYAEKAYFFSGVFNENSPPNLDSTLLYCKKALDFADKIGIKDRYVSIPDVYLLMGLVYEKTGDCKKALIYADKTIALCNSNEDLLTMNNALGIISRCLNASGKIEEAKSFEQKANSLSKILFQEVSRAKH